MKKRYFKANFRKPVEGFVVKPCTCVGHAKRPAHCLVDLLGQKFILKLFPYYEIPGKKCRWRVLLEKPCTRVRHTTPPAHWACLLSCLLDLSHFGDFTFDCSTLLTTIFAIVKFPKLK